MKLRFHFSDAFAVDATCEPECAGPNIVNCLKKKKPAASDAPAAGPFNPQNLA